MKQLGKTDYHWRVATRSLQTISFGQSVLVPRCRQPASRVSTAMAVMTAGALQLHPKIERGFGTERARLGTFRGLSTERAKLGPLKKKLKNFEIFFFYMVGTIKLHI